MDTLLYDFTLVEPEVPVWQHTTRTAPAREEEGVPRDELGRVLLVEEDQFVPPGQSALVKVRPEPGTVPSQELGTLVLEEVGPHGPTIIRAVRDTAVSTLAPVPTWSEKDMQKN